jgi:GNAT superfamily N-acetyltransferase
MDGPTLRVRIPLTDAQLNSLFAAAWPNHTDMTFGPIHERSLTWISAWRLEQLVGYVNVATDGGVHAFLINTTVHPSEQRQGLGRRLVRAAAHQRRGRWRQLAARRLRAALGLLLPHQRVHSNRSRSDATSIRPGRIDVVLRGAGWWVAASPCGADVG